CMSLRSRPYGCINYLRYVYEKRGEKKKHIHPLLTSNHPHHHNDIAKSRQKHHEQGDNLITAMFGKT
ncbi:hypothetical protein QP316_25015, partial [Escherichia coli]|nr:hypothetical protein [Escherichia coli]